MKLFTSNRCQCFDVDSSFVIDKMFDVEWQIRIDGESTKMCPLVTSNNKIHSQN